MLLTDCWKICWVKGRWLFLPKPICLICCLAWVSQLFFTTIIIGYRYFLHKLHRKMSDTEALYRVPVSPSQRSLAQSSANRKTWIRHFFIFHFVFSLSLPISVVVVKSPFSPKVTLYFTTFCPVVLEKGFICMLWATLSWTSTWRLTC